MFSMMNAMTPVDLVCCASIMMVLALGFAVEYCDNSIYWYFLVIKFKFIWL